MDQVHVIRHKVLVEGQSRRSVARQLGVSRNTVRKYLEVSAPVRRESRPRSRPVLEAVAARMESLLEQWSLRSTAKQRVTGSRLHQELVEEGFQVGLSFNQIPAKLVIPFGAITAFVDPAVDFGLQFQATVADLAPEAHEDAENDPEHGEGPPVGASEDGSNVVSVDFGRKK